MLRIDLKWITYLVPRLRHFRWPGTNFVPLAMRMEPMVLAGDRFKQPRAGVTDSTLNDSFELHDDELGPEGEAGSRFNERLFELIYKVSLSIHIDLFKK